MLTLQPPSCFDKKVQDKMFQTGYEKHVSIFEKSTNQETLVVQDT